MNNSLSLRKIGQKWANDRGKFDLKLYKCGYCLKIPSTLIPKISFICGARKDG